jgi:isoleucyl-tRNA synthetase
LHTVIGAVTKDFDKYEFFKYYQLLQNFCVVDLSSFYFDIVKDRLYTHAPKSVSRRGVQTVLEEVLQVLVRLLVPVTPHLAEDIWQHMPEKIKAASSNEISVLLTDFPIPNAQYHNESLEAFWTEMIAVRNIVNKALEQARASKSIGRAEEAQVTLFFEDNAMGERVATLGEDLASIFITSQATVDQHSSNGGNGKVAGVGHSGNGNQPEAISEVNESGVRVIVQKAGGEKCPRCWKFSLKIGEDAKFPELCDECAEALS